MKKTNDKISEVVFRAHLIAHKKFLTIEEFAQWANLSKGYVRNLIHADKLPTKKLWPEGRTFIDMRELSDQSWSEKVDGE